MSDVREDREEATRENGTGTASREIASRERNIIMREGERETGREKSKRRVGDPRCLLLLQSKER